MKEIRVCIGSACHIKGAYDVVKAFQEAINQYGLQSKIELSGSFCLGKCTHAVSVMRWDGMILSVSKENAKEIFDKDIIPYL